MTVDDSTLTKTICELLGVLPGWAWRPTGPAYTKHEVGIYYGAIPATPDRAIGVRVYAAEDNDLEHLRGRRVQLRLRGRPRVVDDADKLGSLAHTALNGLSRVGGISGIRRISMAPLGADSNGREERTENYLIILDNPEASL